MKLYNSELLVFNKHFTDYVRSYVHSTLDKAEISHSIHNITDYSVLIYIGFISHLPIAERLLMSHPFSKRSEMGIDSHDGAWIEIYF